MSFEEQRSRMVEEQLKARGISDERVLEAFRKVPRHLFVPKEVQLDAYADHPLPIGCGQTISQPYIVALMTQLLGLCKTDRVLEIGAGSGYQSAILAELALEVFAVERVPQLCDALKERLNGLGYNNVRTISGNGSLGWREHAPYEAIIVTAAAPGIPKPLEEQLAEGGRLVLPIGEQRAQILVAAKKRAGELDKKNIVSCVFVPLIGKYGWAEEPTQGI